MTKNKFHTNIPKFDTDTGDNILFPFSPPIYQSDLDQNFIKDLISEGNKLTKKDDDCRHKLVGVMKNGGSYMYKDDFILKAEKYLFIYVERFLNASRHICGDKRIDNMMNIQVDRKHSKNATMRLEAMWINYQHKNDFNPPHTHKGALSFVIFCQVPENIFKEQPLSVTESAGHITFSHGEDSHPFDSVSYEIKPYETLFLLFPANMTHFVSPFWTDNVRISVSGNFVVTSNE